MSSRRPLPWRCAGLATVALAAATSLASCNINKFTADTTAKVLEAGSVALDREADLQFAREAFPASLKTMETFLISSPQNEILLLLLARGYSSYAFGILEGDFEKAQIDGTEEQIEELNRRAVLHYLRGREYGFRLLDEPDLEKAARAGELEPLERELNRIEKEKAPALFWTTYGWASAVNLKQEDPEMVAALSTIELMMARVVELDPDYLAGSPLVFQAVYFASRPKMFGGKPAKAKEFFDRAMERHGDKNMLVPYLYARFYAPIKQDKALWDDLMAKVFASDLTEHPDLRLNNEIARDRARFWVAHADELIMEP